MEHKCPTFEAQRCPTFLNALKLLCFERGLVPRRGLEPPHPCERQHLKLVRLPIPPPGHERDELESTVLLVNCALSGFTGPPTLVYALFLQRLG